MGRLANKLTALKNQPFKPKFSPTLYSKAPTNYLLNDPILSHWVICYRFASSGNIPDQKEVGTSTIININNGPAPSAKSWWSQRTFNSLRPAVMGVILVGGCIFAFEDCFQIITPHHWVKLAGFWPLLIAPVLQTISYLALSMPWASYANWAIMALGGTSFVSFIRKEMLGTTDTFFSLGDFLKIKRVWSNDKLMEKLKFILENNGVKGVDQPIAQSLVSQANGSIEALPALASNYSKHYHELVNLRAEKLASSMFEAKMAALHGAGMPSENHFVDRVFNLVAQNAVPLVIAGAVGLGCAILWGKLSDSLFPPKNNDTLNKLEDTQVNNTVATTRVVNEEVANRIEGEVIAEARQARTVVAHNTLVGQTQNVSSAVGTNLGHVNTSLDINEERLKVHRDTMTELSTRVDVHDTILNAAGTRLDVVERQADNLETNVAEIRRNLSELPRRRSVSLGSVSTSDGQVRPILVAPDPSTAQQLEQDSKRMAAQDAEDRRLGDSHPLFKEDPNHDATVREHHANAAAALARRRSNAGLASSNPSSSSNSVHRPEMSSTAEARPSDLSSTPTRALSRRGSRAGLTDSSSSSSNPRFQPESVTYVGRDPVTNELIQITRTSTSFTHQPVLANAQVPPILTPQVRAVTTPVPVGAPAKVADRAQAAAPLNERKAPTLTPAQQQAEDARRLAAMTHEERQERGMFSDWM